MAVTSLLFSPIRKGVIVVVTPVEHDFAPLEVDVNHLRDTNRPYEPQLTADEALIKDKFMPPYISGEQHALKASEQASRGAAAAIPHPETMIEVPGEAIQSPYVLDARENLESVATPEETAVQDHTEPAQQTNPLYRTATGIVPSAATLALSRTARANIRFVVSQATGDARDAGRSEAVLSALSREPVLTARGQTQPSASPFSAYAAPVNMSSGAFEMPAEDNAVVLSSAPATQLSETAALPSPDNFRELALDGFLGIPLEDVNPRGIIPGEAAAPEFEPLPAGLEPEQPAPEIFTAEEGFEEPALSSGEGGATTAGEPQIRYGERRAETAESAVTRVEAREQIAPRRQRPAAEFEQNIGGDFRRVEFPLADIIGGQGTVSIIAGHLAFQAMLSASEANQPAATPAKAPTSTDVNRLTPVPQHARTIPGQYLLLQMAALAAAQKPKPVRAALDARNFHAQEIENARLNPKPGSLPRHPNLPHHYNIFAGFEPKLTPDMV
jgi:hypothetical protein